MEVKGKWGVYASPDLVGLKPLLREWIDVVMDYCRSQGFEDNPWWYNERATLSTLAGAAWRNGWVAIEEFSTSKRARVPDRKTEEGDVRPGRCDLFIGRPRDGEEFAIEAKQAWQSISRRSSGDGTILKAAKLAWDDASHLEADEADTRLALTFIVPYVPPSEVDEVETLVEEWLASEPLQTRRTAPSAYAYVFPNQGGGFINSEGWAFPGVALLAEWRQRRLKGHKAKA